MTDTDLLVVGGGPAGYTAAMRASQLGLDTVLIEKDAYGGTCLNHGCIPSKAIITAANRVHDAKSAREMGITADVDVDFEKLMEWTAGIVQRLTRGVEYQCEEHGVSLVSGSAEFVDSNKALVTSSDGSTQELQFSYAILATGSKPVSLPGFGFDSNPILNAKQIFTLERLPERLVVVGAGYIGMELSTALAKLGTNVTVVEQFGRPLPGYDEATVRPVRRRAESFGIDFAFEQLVVDWTTLDDGTVRVQTNPADRSDNSPTEFEGDAVLVAVGRSPVTDTLNLSATEVETNEDGFIETDARYRTNESNVYAVGDVTGPPLLAHAGCHEGRLAAEYITGVRECPPAYNVPSVVFTDPEIASVGDMAPDPDGSTWTPVVGEYQMVANGRNLAAGRRDGYVSIVAEEATGRIRGGTIVAAEATELIGELGVAVENELTLEDIVATVHAHPTRSEAIAEAATHALNEMNQRETL